MRNAILVFFGCSFLSLFAGCSLKTIKEQNDLLEGVAGINGKIVIESDHQGPVYAQLYRQKEGFLEIVGKFPLTRTGQYNFNMLADTYFIGAFIDENGDGEYQQGEHATYLGIKDSLAKPLTLKENQNLTIDDLTIKGPITRRSNTQIRMNISKINQNIGRIITLDDPMFSRENASMGFWRPFDYAEQFGGGLMMLQGYEEKKIPVIFVHGIFGTALEFEDLIASLNRDNFQPWILHYPSGVRLDMVSGYFLNGMTQLQDQYKFKKVLVVAHSMGGLMIRSFVMKHQQSKSSYELAMVMTINSPLYGLDSAAAGVKSSPIVIPAWRDVASNSDYVAKVHAWRWPEQIPYHLVFSYLEDEGGDGVVPLKSQLSLSLQDEAIKIHGFQAQHAGVLHQSDFIKRFSEIIENYSDNP